MDRFTISQLEQFSGIKSHTIRIWEKRYSALTPIRSKGNTRYYDNQQLRRLLNLVSLASSDYKISEIGSYPDHKLFDLVSQQLKTTEDSHEKSSYFVSQLVAAGTSFDEAYFEKVFSHCMLHYGIQDAYTSVIYPLLQRIGMMWKANTMPPAAEHFMTNIIRQKLYSAIDGLPPQEQYGETWLLFLPEEEFHEIGLLFANYMLRQAGKRVYYLGCNVPLDTLRDTISQLNPEYLLFFLVRHNEQQGTQNYIDNLKTSFRKKTIYLSGNEQLISELKLGNNIHWLGSVEQLENAINESLNNKSKI